MFARNGYPLRSPVEELRYLRTVLLCFTDAPNASPHIAMRIGLYLSASWRIRRIVSEDFPPHGKIFPAD